MEDRAEWHATAEFLQLINDWFDVFNSCRKFGTHPGLNAYGIDLERQDAIITKVSSTIMTLALNDSKKKQTGLLPFQKGILLSNKSLVNL